MRKTINVISSIILPVIAVVVTVLLSHILKTGEKSSLFYVNVVYAALLELVFFGWIVSIRLSKDDITVVTKAISGITSLYYIICGLLIMSIYSLFMSEWIEIKWYVSIIIIITLLWLIISFLITKNDTNNKEHIDNLAEAHDTINILASKIQKLCNKCKNAYYKQGKTYSSQANLDTPINKLLIKIKHLTPNTITNDSIYQLNNIITQCEEWIINFEKADSNGLEDAENKLLDFINNAVSDIDYLKNTNRSK